MNVVYNVLADDGNFSCILFSSLDLSKAEKVLARAMKADTKYTKYSITETVIDREELTWIIWPAEKGHRVTYFVEDFDSDFNYEEVYIVKAKTRAEATKLYKKLVEEEKQQEK